MLEKYLNVFFSGSDKLGVGDHPAKLTVIFSEKQPVGCNVLHLMKVLERAPALQFDVFTLDRRRQVCDKYQAIFAIIFEPLRTHIMTVLADKVDHVSFTSYHSPWLKILIKPEHAEAWMTSHIRNRPQISFVYDKTREWLRNAGVNDRLDGWSVAVRAPL